MLKKPRSYPLAILRSILVASAALLSTTLSQNPSAHASPPKPMPPFKAGVLARLGGKAPNWKRLDVYQKTITRLEFQQLLQHNYLQDPLAAGKLIQILPDRARISKQSNLADAGYYDLFFLKPDDDRIPVTPEIDRYWKPVREFRPALLPNQDLSGLHIVIDPGHIGGSFAQIEERWYQIGSNTIPVTEGDMTLKVAKILKQTLGNLGARVTLTRQNTTPVTPLRATDFEDVAKKWLTRLPGKRKPSAYKLQHTAERLFYLSSEIRERAALINHTLKPDLVICLHFNAEAWGNPKKPDFVEKNHNHILINGCYSLAEIKENDSRLEMLLRLLQRTYYSELAIANEVSNSMRSITKLPPYTYTGNNAKSVNANPYIWSRNLLANRLYLCPVIFLEPYVMNNRQVHSRVQAGPYPGLLKIGHTYRVNLYQEYADSVTAGLLAYFKKYRK